MATILRKQEYTETNKMQTSQINTAINAAYPVNIEQRPIYKTVEQFSNDNPCFTASALRNLIFKAEQRYASNGMIAGNGLLEAGAIIRLGRKVLIDENRFYAWIQGQQVEVV